MILADAEILTEMEKGTILIEPFDRYCLGSNSYDVHLGPFFRRIHNIPLWTLRNTTRLKFTPSPRKVLFWSQALFT